MKQALLILLAFNVVSIFGKEVSYEEFYVEEGYLKTKRCRIMYYWDSFKIFYFRPEQVSFRFTIKDVMEVDTDKHQISFSILTYMIWHEPQVFCRTQVKRHMTAF